MMHKRYNSLKSSFISVKENHSKAQTDIRVLELERMRFREQIEECTKVKVKYEAWKEREPKIKAYLQSFSQLVEYVFLLHSKLC
jgi:hypothetical protein